VNYNTIKLYGKSLALRRGISILVNLTFRCNLACTYCNMILPTGKIRMFDLGLDFWKEKIELFSSIHKVKQVQVSGGEVTLIPWMPEFVRWLLGKGFHVLILSNGYNIDRLMKIPKHYRLQFSFTYHHHTDKDEMWAKYEFLTNLGYRVNLKEIPDGKPKVFDSSIPALRCCQNADDLLKEDKCFPMFNYGPNGRLYSGCYEMYLDCAIPKDVK